MPISVPIKQGLAFWPLPTDEVPKPHPYFVISGVVEGKVLVVNVTDKDHLESTCYIEPGEHESITKSSAVYYRLSCEHDAEKMGQALSKGVGVKVLSGLSPELLARMVAGAKASKDIRDSVKIKYGFKAKESKSGPQF